jgi:hypothetical protein
MSRHHPRLGLSPRSAADPSFRTPQARRGNGAGPARDTAEVGSDPEDHGHLYFQTPCEPSALVRRNAVAYATEGPRSAVMRQRMASDGRLAVSLAVVRRPRMETCRRAGATRRREPAFQGLRARKLGGPCRRYRIPEIAWRRERAIPQGYRRSKRPYRTPGCPARLVCISWPDAARDRSSAGRTTVVNAIHAVGMLRVDPAFGSMPYRVAGDRRCGKLWSMRAFRVFVTGSQVQSGRATPGGRSTITLSSSGRTATYVPTPTWNRCRSTVSTPGHVHHGYNVPDALMTMCLVACELETRSGDLKLLRH